MPCPCARQGGGGACRAPPSAQHKSSARQAREGTAPTRVAVAPADSSGAARPRTILDWKMPA